MEQAISETKTWREVFREYKPEISDKEIDYILWNETCYPFDYTTVLKQIKNYFMKSEVSEQLLDVAINELKELKAIYPKMRTAYVIDLLFRIKEKSFRTKSYMEEPPTIEEFMKNLPINEPTEVSSGDKTIDEIIKTQDEWVASITEPIKDKELEKCFKDRLHELIKMYPKDGEEILIYKMWNWVNENIIEDNQQAEPIKDEELYSKISSAIVHNKYKTSLRKDDVSIMITDVPKAVKEIVEIAKEYAASQNNEWEKALVSLTPSGSEFAGDPENCVRYVKEFQASQHKMICDLVKEKNQLKTHT